MKVDVDIENLSFLDVSIEIFEGGLLCEEVAGWSYAHTVVGYCMMLEEWK